MGGARTGERIVMQVERLQRAQVGQLRQRPLVAVAGEVHGLQLLQLRHLRSAHTGNPKPLSATACLLTCQASLSPCITAVGLHITTCTDLTFPGYCIMTQGKQRGDRGSAGVQCKVSVWWAGKQGGSHFLSDHRKQHFQPLATRNHLIILLLRTCGGR